MTAWNVAEISLRADYINSDSNTLTLVCQSISEVAGDYVNKLGADESVMRSEIEPPSLVAKGIDLKILDALTWTPNHISFKDARAGEQRDFLIRGYSREGSAAKFPLGS